MKHQAADIPRGPKETLSQHTVVCAQQEIKTSWLPVLVEEESPEVKAEDPALIREEADGKDDTTEVNE